MTLFTRYLVVVILSVCFFSCARREQALYQKSQHEPFTQGSASPVAPGETHQSSADSNQVSSSAEVGDVLASVQTDVAIGHSAPVWKSRSKAVIAEKKTAVSRTETNQKKRQSRAAILKHLLTDPPVQTSGLAIASLVCGILGFLFLAVVFGPLAIIFGGVALSKIRKNPEIKGRGLAVAGLVLGIVATIIILVVLAAGNAK